MHHPAERVGIVCFLSIFHYVNKIKEGVFCTGPGPAAGLDALGEAEELAAVMAEELRAAGLPGDLPELEPECRRLLTAFAEGSATLSGCLARRARPVRLCQACGGLYRSLLTQYGNIARAVGVRPVGRGRGPAAGRRVARR